MTFLLQEEAGDGGHNKHDYQHPNALTIYCAFLANHLAHVDAYEEYWHAAPEYLKMSHSVMDGRDPLHQYAPHDHDHGQPTVYGMAAYQLHVWRGK